MNIINIRKDLPKSGIYPKRKLSDTTHIDIHHSASLTENYKGYKTIKQFAYYHVNGHGWPGIGYHYIVTPEDIIYKTGIAREMRWSVGGNNSYTISIMAVGNFDKEEISEDQYKNLLELTRTVMNAYNIPVENVMGHNEFPDQNTKCPGIDMDKLRSDL